VNSGLIIVIFLNHVNSTKVVVHTTAEQRYREVIATFRRLNEPSHEAIYTHQLGIAYQKAQQWEAAEQAYREAARLFESQGDSRMAGSWNQLAQVTELAGKPAEAETWYRKAIDGSKAAGDTANVSKMLSNLANLLQQHFPARLAEARQLAEESLAIDKTLDPVAAQIWKTYNILANIAEQQGETAQAAEYRAKRQAVIASLPLEIQSNLGLANQVKLDWNKPVRLGLLVLLLITVIWLFLQQ